MTWHELADKLATIKHYPIDDVVRVEIVRWPETEKGGLYATTLVDVDMVQDDDEEWILRPAFELKMLNPEIEDVLVPMEKPE